MRRATRRTAWLLAGVTLLWLTSLLMTVTRFGEACTVTLEQGFLGIYWGGDPKVRNSRIDNHFGVPWNSGSGADLSFYDFIWVVHGRHFDWNRLKDTLEHGTLWTCELGFWLPRASFSASDSYVILPLWIAVALTLGAFVLRDARSRRTIGSCKSCDYDLTGNVANRRPERGGERHNSSTARRRPRARTWLAVKWLGTIVSPLIALAATLSFWWYCEMVWVRDGWRDEVEIAKGAAKVTWDCTFGPDCSYLVLSEVTWVGSVFLAPQLVTDRVWDDVDDLTTGVVVVPLWLVILVVALPTALLWWRDRRRIPPGHCQKCGYNLTGNVSGRCPECAAPIQREGTPS